MYGPLVTTPLFRVALPDLLVGDTCALMNEVVQATRNGRPTSLLASMCLDAARVLISRHVLIEIERDLPAYAADRRLDPQTVMAVWTRQYRPLITVVDVPDTWAADSPAVQAVVDRHPVDAPTARLAVALAPCYVLTEDPDLTDYGLGDRDWLPLAHAFANRAELELVGTTAAIPAALVAALGADLGRAAVRLPVVWQCLFAAGLLGLAYRWQKDGRVRRHLAKAGVVVSRAVEVAAPPLLELVERHAQGEVIRLDRVVAPEGLRPLPEQVARELALAPVAGLLAVDIARAVDHEGNLKTRTAAVRATVQDSGTYTQVTRGRWRLGIGPLSGSSTLTHEQLAEWITRAHRDTLPPRSRGPVPASAAPTV